MLKNIVNIIIVSLIMGIKLILTGLFLAIGFSIGSLIVAAVKRKLRKTTIIEASGERSVIETVIY